MKGLLRPVLMYTSLRLAIFAVCLILLGLVGLRGFLLVMLALVASMVVSLPLGRQQRERLATAFEQVRETRSARRG